MPTNPTRKPRLHLGSLRDQHRGEKANPHRWSSPAWLAWEAIDRYRRQGVEVIDAWLSRGTSVNVRTRAAVTVIKVL